MVSKTWITMPSAAALLECSERTVYTLIRDGKLESSAELVNDRPRKVVRLADVERLIRDREAAQ